MHEKYNLAGSRVRGARVRGGAIVREQNVTAANHKTAVPAFCCGKSAEIQQLVARLGYVPHNTVLALSCNT